MAIIQLTQSMTEQEERETQNSNNNFLNTDKLPASIIRSGTWIPTITFDTNDNVVYSTRRGTYVKIDKLVVLNFQIIITALSGNSGLAYLSGLPFIQSPPDRDSSSAIACYANFTGKTGYGLFARGGATSYNFYLCDMMQNGFNNLSASNFQANTILGGTFMYFTK